VLLVFITPSKDITLRLDYRKFLGDLVKDRETKHSAAKMFLKNLYNPTGLPYNGKVCYTRHGKPLYTYFEKESKHLFLKPEVNEKLSDLYSYNSDFASVEQGNDASTKNEEYIREFNKAIKAAHFMDKNEYINTTSLKGSDNKVD